MTEYCRIPSGPVTVGSDDHYPEEAPSLVVDLDAFELRATAVTNTEFASFVDDTGYTTVAERPLDPAEYPGAPAANLVPGSLVFTMTPGPVDLRHLSQWWTWTPGASWRRPYGPASSLVGLEDHPVVHIAHEDAEAFAAWAGERLPTEIEWEGAARGGHLGREYAWGDDAVPDGRYLANFWQGGFPYHNSADDGHAGTAPVRSYPPNDYGCYEMTGNVWEWTSDWYRDDRTAASCCSAPNARAERDASRDPNQPQFDVGRRVIKGGSFLCADEYCRRYRPAARRPQPIDTGMSHIGFRTARDLTERR